MTTETTTDADRQRRLARRVTVGTVVVLLLVAATGLEAWPLTAFRLFSTVRTGTSSGFALVAIAPDGTSAPVSLPQNQVFRSTTHQYADLAHESPTTQHAKVLAWLDAAGIDPADVAAVELVRTTRRPDPAGVPQITAQTVVVRVTP
ncbi:MAG: hypothetical protein AAGC49_09245 [Brevundimonas sp.]